jgi:hypothetical protein
LDASNEDHPGQFAQAVVDRFPKTTLTFALDWPAHWLWPEASPALVRFVESRFEPERTSGEIRRLFGNVLQVSMNPMPLRDIFVTLARDVSKAG